MFYVPELAFLWSFTQLYSMITGFTSQVSPAATDAVVDDGHFQVIFTELKIVYIGRAPINLACWEIVSELRLSCEGRCTA